MKRKKSRLYRRNPFLLLIQCADPDLVIAVNFRDRRPREMKLKKAIESILNAYTLFGDFAQRAAAIQSTTGIEIDSREHSRLARELVDEDFLEEI